MDDWQTPLGVVKNDIELSKLIAGAPGMSADEVAHGFEHSVEVQLPFIQKVLPGVGCSFICMGDQSYRASVELADAITGAAKRLGRRVAAIASSDFNHYESAETARKKDMPAIEAVLRLDAENFHELIRRSKDSACGYGPVTVAALFARRGGAKEGRLLKYGNSGDATDDYKSVVAYASIVFL
jgi:AmmeMemoRadiSam system protein B